MTKNILAMMLSLTLGITFMGCTKKSVEPPKGGASLNITKPLWINGSATDKLLYTKNLPSLKENGNLLVTNAGFWLGNTNDKVSQLSYSFDLAVKKPFSQEKVYTRTILENPSNPNKPIIYENYLTHNKKSVKVKHSPLLHVKMDKIYRFTFEVYSDEKRKKLISKINQPIISVVDNTNGCVTLNDEYMMQIIKTILDQNGPAIPLDKLRVRCQK